MKKIGWALLAVALFLSVVAAGFPASLAWKWWRPSETPLELVDVRGTVWHGAAAQVRWRGRELGALNWNADSSALLTGRIDIALRLSGPAMLSGHWIGGIGSMRLRDIRAELPAQWLAGALMNGALSASGQVHIAIPELAIQSRKITALSGQLLWQDAAIRGLVVVPLGRLRAPFALADEQRVQGTIEDDGGPVSIRGTFAAGLSDYRIEMTLAARDRNARALIDRLGEPLPDGRRRWIVEQRLSKVRYCDSCR